MDQIEVFIQSLSWIYIAILCLGAYSITRLVVTDSLPWVSKPRERIMEKFPPEGWVSEDRPKRGKSVSVSQGWVTKEGHWLGELLSCPWCAGFWISFPICIAFFFWTEITLLVLLPFALRAVVGVVAYRNGG